VTVAAISAREDPPGSASSAQAVRLGIRLLLLSDAMFAIALFAAFLVLQRAQPLMFAEGPGFISRRSTLAVLVCICACVVALEIARRSAARIRQVAGFAGILFAIAAIVSQVVSYKTLLDRRTIVGVAADIAHVYVGTMRDSPGGRFEIVGQRAVIEGRNINLHGSLPQGLAWQAGAFEIDPSKITQEITDGPWRNVFFAGYYALTLLILGHALVLAAWAGWGVVSRSKNIASDEGWWGVVMVARFTFIMAVLIHLLIFFPGMSA